MNIYLLYICNIYIFLVTDSDINFNYFFMFYLRVIQIGNYSDLSTEIDDKGEITVVLDLRFPVWSISSGDL